MDDPNSPPATTSSASSSLAALPSTAAPLSTTHVVASLPGGTVIEHHQDVSAMLNGDFSTMLQSANGTLLTSSSNGSTPISSAAINNNNPAIANNNPTNTTYTIDYLTQLLKDKKQLAAFPNVFHHLERLVDDEINKVRVTLFQTDFIKEAMVLPEAVGDVVTITEKVFVPAKEYPDYNFVGRILGPRGMTAKQLEQETGCKIMVRGKGSMRDKKKEEMNRGKANWEHLQEELHVLIQCEDTPNRCEVKIKRAVEQVKKLLVPAPEGEDELKRKQLMELAIINGTFRNSGQQATAAQLAAAVASSTNKQQLLLLENAAANQRLLTPTLTGVPAGTIRSPNLAGAPIIMSPSRNGQNPAAAANVAAALAQIQQNPLVASVPNPATNPTAAIEYQQLMLNSMRYDPSPYNPNYSMHYDPVNGYQSVPASAAAAIQQQQQQQYVAALMNASAAATPFLGDYAAAVAAANAAAGGGLDISQAAKRTFPNLRHNRRPASRPRAPTRSPIQGFRWQDEHLTSHLPYTDHQLPTTYYNTDQMLLITLPYYYSSLC
ncbi:hypothetical protein L596_010350 [Steinernema carpocapsae]|uniref:K Homology domain-containing protein n=1 Tax=Steinernema carpocapsae TaxID=34508 RepID=A0A4U5PIT2_STECR|nr:hypothetical protein L596_010350 [Steinernema carpocapsae]